MEAERGGGAPVAWNERGFWEEGDVLWDVVGDIPATEARLRTGVQVEPKAFGAANRVVEAGVEYVRFILDSGLETNARFGEEMTLLVAAANSERDLSDVVSLLLARRADPDARCDDDGVALMYARHAGVTKRLLAAGAEPNARDAQGKTPLMYAAKYGSDEVLDALLAVVPEVDLRSQKAWTALMYAARRDNEACVAALLSSGAKTSVRDAKGRTALSLAAERGWLGPVGQILDAGVKSTDLLASLLLAAANGHKEVVRRILAKGCVPGIPTERLPLLIAAHNVVGL